MSRQELINAGWAFLPLGNMKETVVRLNERLEKIKQYKNPSDQGFM
jgi:hypothetical protein